MKIFLLTAFIFIQVSFSQYYDEIRMRYEAKVEECKSLIGPDKVYCEESLKRYEKTIQEFDEKILEVADDCDIYSKADKAGNSLKEFGIFSYMSSAFVIAGYGITFANPVVGTAVIIGGSVFGLFAPFQVYKAGGELNKISDIQNRQECKDLKTKD